MPRLNVRLAVAGACVFGGLGYGGYFLNKVYKFKPVTQTNTMIDFKCRLATEWQIISRVTCVVRVYHC